MKPFRSLLAVLLSCTIASLAYADDQAVPAGHAMPGEPQLRGTQDTVTAPAPPAEPHKGKVVQVINSGGYTYIQLKKKSGEKVWAAIPDTKIEIGSQLTLNPGMVMTNFESKTLKRTFDEIIFTDLPAPPKAGKDKDKKVSGKSPGSGGSSVSPSLKVSVKKASGPNGYIIADLFKNKVKLNKKKVTVRGKVVKVSTNIMGKNWIHLRDGSGDHAKGNFDLVATSALAVPAEGEVVLLSGTLYKDKDFGGGYKYEVVVEDAEFTVE
ncbi:MAG TPA: DNA-binding protein [Geobacteraceae bacterium]